jgi:nicotinamidase-related amidase
LSPVDPEAAVDAPKLVKAFETPTIPFHRPAAVFSTSLTTSLRALLVDAVVATGVAAAVVVGTTGAAVVGTGAKVVDVCCPAAYAADQSIPISFHGRAVQSTLKQEISYKYRFPSTFP